MPGESWGTGHFPGHQCTSGHGLPLLHLGPFPRLGVRRQWKRGWEGVAGGGCGCGCSCGCCCCYCCVREGEGRRRGWGWGGVGSPLGLPGRGKTAQRRRRRRRRMQRQQQQPRQQQQRSALCCKRQPGGIAGSPERPWRAAVRGVALSAASHPLRLQRRQEGRARRVGAGKSQGAGGGAREWHPLGPWKMQQLRQWLEGVGVGEGGGSHSHPHCCRFQPPPSSHPPLQHPRPFSIARRRHH